MLPLNSTSQTAWAADCLASRRMPFDTHSLLPPFFLAPVAFVAGMCLTTLARLPFRLDLGRVWTPSFIFRTLSPFVLLSVLGYYFAFRCYLYLCIVSIWILARWSRCCIHVLLGSIVKYCDVTICDQIHLHCVYVLRGRDVWWASSNRFYAEFGGNR